MHQPDALATPGERLVFTEKFSAELDQRFGLTEEFVRRLFSRKRPGKELIDRWEDLINPGQSMSGAYIHFALSNVVRGRQARDLIMRKTGIATGRSLDVGSAYGGMVAAFAEKGFVAQGIEIDGYWCELGNLNCRSKGFGDLIAAGDFLAMRGQCDYDVITCNDVIEHVAEPRRALAKMAAMLKPNGALYLVIPNARSWDHVVRDGHYGQFGMNLLDHYAAKHLYDIRCRSTYDKDYSCGEFYPLVWYREQLESHGLDVEVCRANKAKLPSGEEFAELLGKLDRAFSTWDLNGLPELLVDRVVLLFQEYRQRLMREYQLLSGTQEPQASACLAFAEEFLDSFWTLLAVKRS